MAWSSRLSRRFSAGPDSVLWAYLTIPSDLLQSRNSIGAVFASHANACVLQRPQITLGLRLVLLEQCNSGLLW